MLIRLIALLVISCIPIINALDVLQSSSCASACIDSGVNTPFTNTSDIVCQDASYGNTPNGQKFKQCVDCLLNSTASDVATSQTDLGAALYNMRYAFNWCTLGFPNNKNLESTPCEVSCTPLLSSTTFDMSNTSTAIAPYGYCDANGGAFSAGVSVCSSCLRLVADQTYIANFLLALKAGCQQRQKPGQLLQIFGDVFSSTPITFVNITTPQSGVGPGLTSGTRAGIGLGAAAGGIVLIAVLIICIPRCRERQRRRKGGPVNDRYSGRYSGHFPISRPVAGGYADIGAAESAMRAQNNDSKDSGQYLQPPTDSKDPPMRFQDSPQKGWEQQPHAPYNPAQYFFDDSNADHIQPAVPMKTYSRDVTPLAYKNPHSDWNQPAYPSPMASQDFETKGKNNII